MIGGSPSIGGDPMFGTDTGNVQEVPIRRPERIFVLHFVNPIRRFIKVNDHKFSRDTLNPVDMRHGVRRRAALNGSAHQQWQQDSAKK